MDIERVFSHHDSTHGQVQAKENVRSAAKDLARAIRFNTPACADQTVALRKLRECVAVALESIMLEGRIE